MPKTRLTGLRLRPPSRFPQAAGWARGILFGLFAIIALLSMLRQAWPRFLAGSLPPNDALYLVALIAAVAATIAASTNRLPFQNVLLASVVIFILVLGVILLNDATGIPLGAWAPAAVPHEQLLWILPMVWLTALLNCRGVASLLLNPWRSAGNYGLRVLVLATVLCFLFVASLEPFAVNANRYWGWRATRIPITWYSTPLLVLWTWTLISFIGQALITPALIQKIPVPRPPGVLHFWIWLLLRLVILTVTARRQLWFVSALAALELITISVWLVRVRLLQAPARALDDGAAS